MHDHTSIIPIADIRRVAGEVGGWKEVQFSNNSHIIAFKDVGDIRVNVYYTTGTVGTYLEHPRMGRTQLFRRNVDLTLLKQIFENPRVHTDLGYHLKSEEKKNDSGDANINAEEAAMMEQVKKLKREREVINTEMSVLEAVLDRLKAVREAEGKRIVDELKHKAEEEKRKQEEEAEEFERQEQKYQDVLDEWERQTRGTSFAWSNLMDSDHVRDALCKTTATCLAIGGDSGDSALAIFEDGGYNYTSGLPTDLYNKLHTRPKHAPKPDYCAMGSRGRFYISFTNGKNLSVAPEGFWDVVKDSNRVVKCVAFGEDWDTFFVVYTDGWYISRGDIPVGLRNILEKRDRRPDLDFVSLGPDGEWLLRAKNGKLWYGGVHQRIIDEISVHQNIKSIYWGSDNSYIIRYIN